MNERLSISSNLRFLFFIVDGVVVGVFIGSGVVFVEEVLDIDRQKTTHTEEKWKCIEQITLMVGGVGVSNYDQ